jgi:hypothetical protein
MFSRDNFDYALILTQCTAIYFCGDDENQYIEVIKIDYNQATYTLETQIILQLDNTENFVSYDVTIFTADGAENFPAPIDGFQRDAIITASYSYKRGILISFPQNSNIPVIMS